MYILSVFFPLQNTVCFIILTYLVPVLLEYYIQGVLKLKKKFRRLKVNRATLQVFVTYLTGALYVHRLWFYKHQHDNPVPSELSVACQQWWFQWRFWFVPSVPGYTRTLSLETVHTTFEWYCQMVVVSRIWCRISAGQLYTR